MTHEQLLDIFYGRDNLVLFCSAKRFRTKTPNFISFIVNKFVIRVKYLPGRFYPFEMMINDRVLGVSYHRGGHKTPESIRRYFTIITRYVLDL